ncbi:MAG: DUF2953 domain-containing protein [Clostridia bacterium]|nr:DUF2953 domain-containing protein [Clostridia bacterium]
MIILWILGILLFSIGVLCLTRIRFEISANEELSVKLNIYGIKIPLYPQNKKKVRVGRFKKGYPTPKTKKESSKTTEKPKDKEASKEKIALSDQITTIIALIKLLLSRIFKHLRLDVSRIVVTVGAEDAAKCAITYGIVSQSVAYLLEFLDHNLNIHKKRGGEIHVYCDFTEEKVSYDIFLSASMTVWQILDIGISLAYNYLKGKDIFHLINS